MARQFVRFCIMCVFVMALANCSEQQPTSVEKPVSVESAPQPESGVIALEPSSKPAEPPVISAKPDNHTAPSPAAPGSSGGAVITKKYRKSARKPASVDTSRSLKFEAPKTAAPKTPMAAQPKKNGDQATEEANHTIVKVFYATDRSTTGQASPNDFYGIGRGELTYGISEVAIPKSHDVGALEAPKWWKFEFRENPDNHVMLTKVQQLAWEAFRTQLNSRIDSGAGSNAFIFIHGFNVRFKDAARRTAQIHHDLKFDGAPIFYSWPSQGEVTLTSYTHDETNATWALPHVIKFIRAVADQSTAQNIYLIAHSMGTRVLSNAVATLMRESPKLKKRFKDIILAAPDIDADVFKNNLAPMMKQAANNVTLYASSDDKALKTSQQVHGGFPRAGDAGENLVLLEGVDTIDATGVDNSILAHSYFAEAKSIIGDIQEIIDLQKSADNRSRLKAVTTDRGSYWEIKK